MVWSLHLQGCASGHGSDARIALPEVIRYSIVESSHCQARIGRKLFGRTISAAGARAIFIILRPRRDSERKRGNPLQQSTVLPRARSTPPAAAGCARDDNEYVMFDLRVGLANDQASWGIIRRRSRRSRRFSTNGRKRASKVIAHTRAALRRTIAPLSGRTAAS